MYHWYIPPAKDCEIIQEDLFHNSKSFQNIIVTWQSAIYGITKSYQWGTAKQKKLNSDFQLE